MGIIASAQRRGIPVTDVQHGVQGEFHGMYAGFTCVPEHGYEFLPRWFWCWGDSAVKDIMSSSRNRSHHIAISGGYPWIDYWRMLQEHRPSIVFCSSRNKPRCQLLVTLRGPYGDHTERVPDFLVDFLRKDHPNTFVVFRTHPNDPAALNYLRSRLKKPLKTSFVVTSFETDLYTTLSQSTHLLTAYSTVCYEASIFDVPTLLYGKDALEAFQQSINDGTFHWTSGTLSDLERFLEKPQTIGEPRNSYMLSSLDLAQKTAKYLIDGDHKSK